MSMGELAPPESEKPSVNLDAARQTIELLVMLREKTKGNLENQERELLHQLLADLPMKKKGNPAIIRIVISACALGLVFYASRGKLLYAFSYFSEMDFIPLLAGVVIMFGSLFVVSQRLRLILSVQGVFVPRLRLYYLWMISLFFNLFLPSAIGGDIAKAYYIYKDSGRKAAAVSSVLVDRFLGLAASVSIAAIAFFLVRPRIRHPQIGVVLICFLTIIIVGSLFVLSHRFSAPLKTMMLYMLP